MSLIIRPNMSARPHRPPFVYQYGKGEFLAHGEDVPRASFKFHWNRARRERRQQLEILKQLSNQVRRKTGFPLNLGSLFHGDEFVRRPLRPFVIRWMLHSIEASKVDDAVLILHQWRSGPAYSARVIELGDYHPRADRTPLKLSLEGEPDTEYFILSI